MQMPLATPAIRISMQSSTGAIVTNIASSSGCLFSPMSGLRPYDRIGILYSFVSLEYDRSISGFDILMADLPSTWYAIVRGVEWKFVVSWY